MPENFQTNTKENKFRLFTTQWQSLNAFKSLNDHNIKRRSKL